MCVWWHLLFTGEGNSKVAVWNYGLMRFMEIHLLFIILFKSAVWFPSMKMTPVGFLTYRVLVVDHLNLLHDLLNDTSPTGWRPTLSFAVRGRHFWSLNRQRPSKKLKMFILSHKPNLLALMQFSTLPPRSKSCVALRITRGKLGTLFIKNNNWLSHLCWTNIDSTSSLEDFAVT